MSSLPSLAPARALVMMNSRTTIGQSRRIDFMGLLRVGGRIITQSGRTTDWAAHWYCFRMKHFILVIISIGWICAYGRADEPATAPLLPTFWIVGDSTVSNPQKGMAGWGTPIAKYFDPTKIKVVNKARGGRSSRTYIAEGLWDQVVPQIKPGDFVIVQFGHNDGGAVNGPKVTGRASLPGNGEKTEATTRPSGEPEFVHTFGWYMRKYAGDAKAKGATVILCSHIPRREWEPDGTVQRNAGSFGKWTREAAEQSGAYFLD